MKNRKIANKIYLAGPIFTEKDRMYLDWLYERLVPIFPNAQIYVPHRNKSINDKTKCAFHTEENIDVANNQYVRKERWYEKYYKNKGCTI